MSRKTSVDGHMRNEFFTKFSLENLIGKETH